jgi:LCP family protein required for cell wall assembly
MKVNLGTYNKNKAAPKIIGPKRRGSRKALAQKAISKSRRKRGRWKKYLVILVIIVLFVGAGAALVRFNYVKGPVGTVEGSGIEVCDNILNPACWNDVFKPQYKESNGYTNALLLGVDTRPAGQEMGLKNTDTVIIASINHEKKKAMLISIPRDMLVDVYIKDSYCCRMKVNSVYALADARTDVDDGLNLITENLERMLGIEIHYQAIVDFQAVIDAVDAVGGVTIDVPDNMSVWYPEETPPYNYQLYEFTKGPTEMDGHLALVWARFRKVYVGPLEYASDFSRAERQQQVINAVKDKVLGSSDDLIAKAQEFWNLFQTYEGNVTLRNVTFEDGLAAVSLIDEYDTSPVRVILDPNFGGLNNLIYHPPTTDQFGYYIIPRDESWATIRAELERIWEYPDVYDDGAVVVISNRSATGTAVDSPYAAIQSVDIPFGALYAITEATTEEEGIKIYDFSNGAKQGTIDFLVEYLGQENVTIIQNPSEAGVSQTGYYEDIKVEFGPPITQTTETEQE